MNAGNLGEEDINLAKSLRGKVELGCHPGYEDASLHSEYKHWGSYNWQKELGILIKHD